MNSPKLVCPADGALIGRFERRTLCVRVNAPQDIVAAAADARKRNALHCVICDCSKPLEDIEADENWRGIPIALMAPSVGKFRNYSKMTGLLRALNLRVYLPCDGENLTGARLLASVGIPTCVVFDADDAPDWEALADLMTYALLAVAPHAPIEPFRTMALSYRRDARGEDWGRTFFDDPSRYLHVDATGRIALSRRELLAGDFIADDVSELDSPEVREAVETRREMWRDVFLENQFCARCKAWRLCRGRFSEGKTEPDGCAAFFDETAEVIERQRKAKSNGAAGKWQP